MEKDERFVISSAPLKTSSKSSPICRLEENITVEKTLEYTGDR